MYIGSVHGGELPEMYGFTGDHVGTDAYGIFIHFLSFRDLGNENHVSELYQPSEP